jgi:hypothetical protein
MTSPIAIPRSKQHSRWNETNIHHCECCSSVTCSSVVQRLGSNACRGTEPCAGEDRRYCVALYIEQKQA